MVLVVLAAAAAASSVLPLAEPFVDVADVAVAGKSDDDTPPAVDAMDRLEAVGVVSGTILAWGMRSTVVLVGGGGSGG